MDLLTQALKSSMVVLRVSERLLDRLKLLPDRILQSRCDQLTRLLNVDNDRSAAHCGRVNAVQLLLLE